MPYLQSLKLYQFRNFTEASWEFAPGFNIIVGQNGSGKTSILEAIYFLAHGRSFRAKELNRMMQHQRQQFTIFAQGSEHDTPFSLAMQRSMRGDHKNCLNHTELKSASQLADRLPVLLFNPESFQLLMGGAKNRRQLLDWGVFYHYPQIRPDYLTFKKALKQRNAALKQNLPQAQIKLWDQALLASAINITQARIEYCEKLISLLEQLLPEFIAKHRLRFHYEQGWPEREALNAVWERSLIQDLRAGLTQHGPHQADLKILSAEKPARDVLSRGQQKLFISMLKLIQGRLLAQETSKTPIYLLDDLASELDRQHQEYLAEYLRQERAQVLLTCIHLEAGSFLHQTDVIRLN